MSTSRAPLSLALMLVVLAACGGEAGQIGAPVEPPPPKAIALDVSRPLSWDEFQALIYDEPDSDVFVVDGDTPIVGAEGLRLFYLEEVKGDAPLAVATSRGADVRWTTAQQRALTYCVSRSGFGARYAAVVTSMREAADAWASAADVRFVHADAEDGACNASNPRVVFDVRPANARGSYLARAFFPDQSRSTRNVLIDGTAFGGDPSLTGILTHELGHVLGFRHEHTRPEASACFEDSAWRGLTTYDPTSVMHYPQCNGTAPTLALSALDREGAARLYGPPAGTTPTPSPSASPSPSPSPSAPGVRVTSLEGSLSRGQSRRYNPLAVAAGSTVEVTTTGTGDADLYVGLGSAPSGSNFACRSDGQTAAERCVVTAGSTPVYITVLGYSATRYALTVRYVPR